MTHPEADSCSNRIATVAATVIATVTATVRSRNQQVTGWIRGKPDFCRRRGLRSATEWKINRMGNLGMEARAGFEPANKGFADLSTPLILHDLQSSATVFATVPKTGFWDRAGQSPMEGRR